MVVSIDVCRERVGVYIEGWGVGAMNTQMEGGIDGDHHRWDMELAAWELRTGCRRWCRWGGRGGQYPYH